MDNVLILVAWDRKKLITSALVNMDESYMNLTLHSLAKDAVSCNLKTV